MSVEETKDVRKRREAGGNSNKTKRGKPLGFPLLN
jgi:hypothetical protein